MKALVIGGGGREHALAWKLARSPRIHQVITCPGNGGTALLGPTWDLDPIRDSTEIESRIGREKIDRVVIGPEAPLVDGLADRLRGAGVVTFGPGASASRLEGSKAFTKEFLSRHQIPTAKYRVLTSPSDVAPALESFSDEVVVKADGLASGKGVVVCSDRAEAERVAIPMLDGTSFGDAGRVVVLEERLIGVEVSILAFVAGTEFRRLEAARDYKPLLDGNHGPNTGGMGSYSPAGTVNTFLAERIDEEIIRPSLEGLAAEGIPYQGVLYVGLMLTEEGPQVLEFNCRFGDPETQPLMLRLETDLVDVIDAIAEQRLGEIELSWDPRTALCVVLSAEGYPARPKTGAQITGPIHSDPEDELQVFHAATRSQDGKLVSAGGRVLGVTALGSDRVEARTRAYEHAHRIHYDGRFFRGDIGG